MTQHLQQQPSRSRTSKEVAGLFGISEATLRLWRRHGSGPRYFLAGPRLIRYRQSDLDAWVESRAVSKRNAEAANGVTTLSNVCRETVAAIPCLPSARESISGACAHLGGTR